MKIVERSSPRPHSGFSLMELMVTVAIIAILASIALPSYSEYITRSRLVDAHTRLGDLRIQMEKYFQDNRTYLAGAACGITAGQLATANADPGPQLRLHVSRPHGDHVHARRHRPRRQGHDRLHVQRGRDGRQVVDGTGGWTAAPNCWFVRKDGSCS